MQEPVNKHSVAIVMAPFHGNRLTHPALHVLLKWRGLRWYCFASCLVPVAILRPGVESRAAGAEWDCVGSAAHGKTCVYVWHRSLLLKSCDWNSDEDIGVFGGDGVREGHLLGMDMGLWAGGLGVDDAGAGVYVIDGGE